MMVMAGDEVILDEDAELGPIDPQMMTASGPSPGAGRDAQSMAFFHAPVTELLYSGQDIKLEGEEYLIMREDEVLAVIDSSTSKVEGLKRAK